MEGDNPPREREDLPAASPAGPAADPMLDALRAGDDAAFASLVDRYHASLVRLAMVCVRDRAVAEEVAQETWLAVLEGLSRFEGRSSLKTWLFRILMNRARTRATRESRSVAFSTLAGDEGEEFEPFAAVAPSRFLPASHPRWAGHWSDPPRPWASTPEDELLAREVRAHINDAISQLPRSQQEVINLRDIDGLTSEEACNILGLTETNQRVLLHRARSRVRQALEDYLESEQGK